MESREVVEEEQEKKNKKFAALYASLTFVVCIGLLILFVNWDYPDPLPEEEVVLLVEPEGSEPGGASAPMESTTEQPTEPEEQVEEQVEEQAEVESDAQEEESVEATTSTTVTDPGTDNSEEEEYDPTRLYTSSTSDETSENDNSSNSNSNSNSNGLDGDESGPGFGTMGAGNWNLSGRGMAKEPSLESEHTVEGTVVIDIWVDRDGNVIRTKNNVLKTNTTDSDLISKARKAAKKTKFTTKASAAVEQKGSITFVFTVG